MTYTSASNVMSYVRTLKLSTTSASTFDSTTIPTTTDVSGWLSAGYSRINTALATAGYSTPIAPTATAYAQVAELEALYGAAMVYSVRMVQQVTGQSDTRSNFLLKQFETQLQMLTRSDLTMAGVIADPSRALPYAGGISIGDKDTVTDNTDRVEPRFRRNQHDVPGVDWETNTNED